jgi:hypothetical protein
VSNSKPKEASHPAVPLPGVDSVYLTFLEISYGVLRCQYHKFFLNDFSMISIGITSLQWSIADLAVRYDTDVISKNLQIKTHVIQKGR